jgi:hypothetical protein
MSATMPAGSLDQQFADVIVELGEDLAAHQVADRLGQRGRSSASSSSNRSAMSAGCSGSTRS